MSLNNTPSLGEVENRIRDLRARERALQMGVPAGLLDRRPPRPVIEGVPPLPRQAPQQPQQIFPAPADFPPEPEKPLRSVLKRGE